MFCEKCGAKLSEGAAFCEKCGAPVGNKKEESETSKKTVAEKKVKPVKQEKKSGEKKPHKKSKAPLIIGAAAIIAAIAAVIFFVILPGRLTASTMFLTDYDGDVTLSDADGKELKLSKDRQMADGNELDTEEESKAYVTLDEERFVTLMQLSHAAFMQNGRKMRLELEEGSLFFNVARVLEDDESLEIGSPNVVIGIRGTSGYVVLEDEDTYILYMTSGYVEAVATNPNTDEEQTEMVYAGEKLTVVIDGDEITIEIERLEPMDMPPEMIEEIVSDFDLAEHVLEDTGWSGQELVDAADANDVSIKKSIREKLLEIESSEGLLSRLGISRTEYGTYSVRVFGANETGNIEGASVIMTSEDTDEEYELVTGADGYAYFDEIPVGNYILLCDADGFNARSVSVEVTVDGGSRDFPLAPDMTGDDCYVLLEWEGDQNLDLCSYNEGIKEYVNIAHPLDSTNSFIYADNTAPARYELIYLKDLYSDVSRTIYVLDTEAAQMNAQSSMCGDGVTVYVYSSDGLLFSATASDAETSALWSPCKIVLGDVYEVNSYVYDFTDDYAWISLEEADQVQIQPWMQAYYDYFSNWETDTTWGQFGDYFEKARLIYVDDDDIPEVVTDIWNDTVSTATYFIYSYQDGVIYQTETFYDLEYVEYGGVMVTYPGWGDNPDVQTLTDTGFSYSGSVNDTTVNFDSLDMTKAELLAYFASGAGGSDDSSSGGSADVSQITGTWFNGDVLYIDLYDDGTCSMMSNGNDYGPYSYTFDGETVTFSSNMPFVDTFKWDGNSFTCPELSSEYGHFTPFP